MAEAIQLDIGGNTSRLDRDIQKTVNKAYTINLQTKGSQPLGRITGQVNEFTKSLDASNARVIAFGASAGVIFGLQRAFQSLVTSTIEVQKSLADINVILNVSSSQLASFGGDLFKIAKSTGQSFDEVAKAATEFSRQGLGVAETLKRTSEALILSRLSGLDAAKSVEALTAAVNSFASQAVTATDIVNKFANVDAAFAVSSADLADAISRVGSSAAQSGVQLDELIALVTSAQQTTARGGAVIGNSFKTIFTRLQRGKVVDLLGSLGISDTDASGSVKSTIQLLQDLAAVYDTLGARQQAAIAEQVGGVFQINILKATLADLGKEYSTYNSALNVSASSTDEAIKRNEALNKTYSAQINALQENAKQLAATAGSRLLGPAFDRVVGNANSILGGINESDGQSYGAVLGKGILDGLGQFIAGPGLALIGGVLLKLFKDFSKFAGGSVRELLGLNAAANQQRDIQQSISQILEKNPKLIDLAMKGEAGLIAASARLLSNLELQTAQLAMQEKIAGQIAAKFYASGGRVSGGVPVAPTKKGKAHGFIPNYVKDGALEKAQAMALGATPSVRAHMSKGTIGGSKFVMNNQETEYTGVGRNGDSMVIPHYAARGFIPNFIGISSLKPSASGSKVQDYKTILKEGANYKGQFQKSFGTLTSDEANRALTRARSNKGQVSTAKKNATTNLGNTNKISLIYGKKAGVGTSTGFFTDSNKNRYSTTFKSSGFNAEVEPEESNLEDLLGNNVIDFVNRFSSIFGANQNAAKISNINELANSGAFRSIAGTIFETAVTKATGSALAREGGQTAPIDYVSPNAKLRQLFNNIPGAYEAKIGNNQDLVNSVAEKAYKSGFFKKQGIVPGGRKGKASGFIPNFSSTNRGVPISQIRAHFDKSGSPVAVTNTRDEPNGLKDAIGRERKGIGMYAGGFIPNYADDTTGIGVGVAAVSTELIGLSYILQGSGGQYKRAIDEIKLATGQSATKIQKFGAAADAYGSAIAIGAPIIAATVKGMIPQDTKGGRGTAAAVSGLGNVASMGATGAQLGLAFGPQGALVGAALGAAAGALMSIPDVITGFTSSMPELTKASEEASQSLTKFGDLSQRLGTASETLSNALSEAVPSGAKIKKAQDDYAAVLSEFSIEDQKRISGSTDQKSEIEKIRGEKERTAKNAERNVAAGQLYDKSSSVGGFGQRLLSVNAQSGDKAAIKAAQENIKAVQDAYTGNLLQGKTGKEAGDVFAKLKESGTSEKFRQLGYSGGDINTKLPELRKLFEESLPDFDGKAAYIEQQLNLAGTSALNFGGVVYAVAAGIDENGKKIQESNKNAEEYTQNLEKEQKAKTAAMKATESTVSIIESNMRIALQAAEAERALGQSRRQFSRDTALADKFTRPAETVKALVGDEAPLAQKFQSKADVAGIDKTFQDGVDKITYGLTGELNTLISSSATAATQKTITDASGQEGVKATDITKAASEADAAGKQQVKAFQDIQGILNQNIQGNAGQLNFDTLKTELSAKFDELGLDTQQQTDILNKLNEGSSSANIELQKLRQESIQQLSTLAKETTQRILIAKIAQAQKFAGGIEEYINPPKPGESTFDKAIKATQGMDQFQGQKNNFAFDYQKGTNEFKYQYPEAAADRKKQAPEYGRESLKLIGGLQDYFGYTPNPEGKASKAGVEGLKVTLDEQVKEFQKIASDSKTPDIVRDEINNALKEVSALGGTGNIAKIQVAKKTGALSEEGFQKITGKFNDPVLEQLKQTNPELAMMKAAEMIISDDPTVKAVNKSNSILVDIRNALAGGTESGVTTLDAQGNPVGLTGGASTDLSKQVTGALATAVPTPQPQPQKSISEIERETREKRDQRLRGVINPQGILGPSSSIGPSIPIGEADVQKNIQSQIKPLTDLGSSNLRPLSEISNDVNRASYDMNVQRKGLYSGSIGEEVQRRKLEQNPLLTLTPQAITTDGPKPDINRPQEVAKDREKTTSAVQTNTSSNEGLTTAIKSLEGAAQTLAASMDTNAKYGQVTQGGNSASSTQGGSQSSNIGPFNVVVNGSQGDISSQLNSALEKLKSEILALVNVKVPPTVPSSQAAPKTSSTS